MNEAYIAQLVGLEQSLEPLTYICPMCQELWTVEKLAHELWCVSKDSEDELAISVFVIAATCPICPHDAMDLVRFEFAEAT